MRLFQMDSLCAFPALRMRGMLKLTVTFSHTEMLISHLWQKTESLLILCLHPLISANIQAYTYRRLHTYTSVHSSQELHYKYCWFKSFTAKFKIHNVWTLPRALRNRLTFNAKLIFYFTSKLHILKVLFLFFYSWCPSHW